MTKREHIVALIAKWRNDAERELPYSVATADAIDRCAKELEALVIFDIGELRAPE